MHLLCSCCVLWQANSCYKKYASNPTGAQYSLASSKEVAISFTLCKVLYNLQQNVNGRLLNERVKHLKEIIVVTNNEDSFDLLTSFSTDLPLTYEFVASVPEPYLCKEIPLPNRSIRKVKVVHNAYDKDRNFHLFIHPTGMFFHTEMVVQYSNKIFHHDFDGRAEVKMESYDLTSSPTISCGGDIYHDCKMKMMIKEFNNTMGCSYPIQR